MDSLYLLAAYVTQEQERAVRSMFNCNGWEFKKEEVMQSLLVVKNSVASNLHELGKRKIPELSEISLLKTRPANDHDEVDGSMYVQTNSDGSESGTFCTYSVEGEAYQQCEESSVAMDALPAEQEEQSKHLDHTEENNGLWQDNFNAAPPLNSSLTNRMARKRKNARKKTVMPMYVINRDLEDSGESIEETSNISENSPIESFSQAEYEKFEVSLPVLDMISRKSPNASKLKSKPTQVVIKREKLDESELEASQSSQSDPSEHAEKDKMNKNQMGHMEYDQPRNSQQLDHVDIFPKPVKQENIDFFDVDGGFLDDGQISISLKQDGDFDMYQPLSQQNSSPFMCTICGNEYEDKHDLFEHVKCHIGESLFTCSYCRKEFSSESQLRSHLRLHTADKPFTCSTCGKCFSQAQYLKKHLSIHSGERPYTCEVCGKSFNSAAGKWHHRKTHQTVKPYSCDICGKAFSRQFNLRSHRTLHTGDLSLACAVCGKAFQSVSSLQSHLRTHKTLHVVPGPLS